MNDREGAHGRRDRAPLLGRDRELDLLVELLDEAPRGGGRHALVVGAAGIGKSRLLRELEEIARRTGVRTLAASGDPLTTDAAFGTLLELIAPLAAEAGGAPAGGGAAAAGADAARARLFGGGAALVLPLLEPAPGPLPADAAQRYVHGAYRLLANAAAEQPLLVLVDDVQWADRGTLAALAHLAARAARHPLVVVAAQRAGEQPADADALERFRVAPPATVVELGPLDRAALTALAAELGRADAPASFLDACAAASGGNPLLMAALLRDVGAVAGGDAAGGGVASGGVLGAGGGAAGGELAGVETIARYVEAQLTRLPPLAGELARMAAVLGDGAMLRQAARLAGADLDRAAAAADRLLAAGLLATVEPLAFTHPIVRASLHDHIAPARRGRLHAAAARQLTADRADRERIAAHLLRALPGEDGDVVERLREAAVQARARAAPESAIAYLRRALEEPPADWQTPSLLLELGTAQAAIGDGEAAATLTEAAARLHGRERAEAFLWLGRTRFAHGALLEAAQAFDAGLATLAPALGDAPGASAAGATSRADAPDSAPAPPAPADAAVRELAAELNAGFIGAARFETTLRPEAYRRLTPLLETPADGQTRGERALLAEVALEQGIRGAPPATAVATALRAWADGRILDELDVQGIVLSQIAATLTWSDALADSERVLDATVAHAERNGAAHQRATAAYLRAWPRYYRGALADADADARAALATPGWQMYEPAAHAVIALVALERGDLATVAEALDVPGAAERWAGSIPYAMLLEAEGRVALARGDAAAALAAFERCGALISALETTHPFCPWRSLAALALARLGDGERARALAAEEVAHARALGVTRPLGAALRAAALVADAPGADAAAAPGAAAPAERIALLRESAAVLAESPARLDLARTLVELGTALTDDGAADEARETLRTAAALAAELGATVLEERAGAALVATGARPRRTATSGPGALTPSERRIARLAALGLTNAEIAAEAVVVPKTVQFHLTNVYRKLGVDGRDQLGPALDQLSRD